MMTLMMMVRRMIDQPQFPANPLTHFSDRSSGTTITLNIPKLIASASCGSIALSTSKSFGPTKKRIGASGSAGSIAYDTSSRGGSFEPSGGGIDTG